MNAPGYLSVFTTEHKVEAAQRVIDSGRTVAGVGRELGVNGGWCRRALMPACDDWWVPPGSVGKSAAQNRCGRCANTSGLTPIA